MSKEKTAETVEQGFEVKGDGVIPEPKDVSEVQQMIDEEYKVCKTRCTFYKGVYLGDFDYEHLLKLAKILTGIVLTKETK